MTEVPQSPTSSSEPPVAGQDPNLFDNRIVELQNDLAHAHELRHNYDKRSDKKIADLRRQIDELRAQRVPAAHVGDEPSPPTPQPVRPKPVSTPVSARPTSTPAVVTPAPSYQQAPAHLSKKVGLVTKIMRMLAPPASNHPESPEEVR